MAESRRTPPEVPLLLSFLDEAYERKSWHGPNLKGALRGISAAQALWRPAPGRHNIAELALHAAYWKYVVRRKLTGVKRGSFSLEGSNWFRSEELTDAEWKTIVALVASEHAQLRAAVAALKGEDLGAQSRLARGIAAHDLYHAGQIQLLKRLQEP